MKRNALALVAAALAACALFGSFRLATADRDTKVGNNVLVNPPALIDANNSPSIVRNPRRPANVALSYRVDRPGFSAAVAWSEDGGITWGRTALPLPEGKDRPFAADVAFAPDGILYVTYVHLEGAGNVPATLWLSSSRDGGRTLSAPIMVSGRLAFQARLAIARSGAIHVTWLQGREVALYRFTSVENPIVAVSSTDGGRTFSRPVQLSDPERERVGVASPVLDDKDELVVLYEDFKGDRRDFENLEGPAWSEPFALVITRSSDGGRTFSKGVEVESGLVPTKRFLVFLPDFPSLAAGPDGSMFVTWADGRNEDEDAFIRRSDDGGRTWAPPVRVNDNPKGDGTAQYLPMVAVAPGGRVDVVFLDRRRDRNNVMTDATVASSHDQGRSFENVQLSEVSFDSRVGPSADLKFGVDFGSRLGLVSDDDRSLAAWTDTRLGSEDTGRQYVMATAFQIPTPTGGLASVPAIAGLLGLCLLVLAAAWRMGGRGGGATLTTRNSGPAGR